MQYWNISPKTWLLTLVVILNFSAQAQENSPYSRYGIGNLKQIENVANRGMGGVSIADDNPLIVNPANPATYSNLKLTSYQVGMEGSLVRIKNINGSNQVGTAGFNYVNVGFPVHKNVGVSFGLLPFTRMRYNMEKNDTLPFGIATSSFAGGGGLQNIYLGASYKYDDYSIGFNTGYTFGNTVTGTEVTYTDSLSILPNNFNVGTSAGGFYYQIGGLMNKKIKEEYAIRVGVSYTGAQNLKATRDKTWDYLIPKTGGTDTAYFEQTSTKGRIVLPSKFAIGTMLVNGDYWQVGIDYNSSNWGNYKAFDERDSMGKSWIMKVGGAFTPDANAVVDYWKKITFRAGFYVGQDILRLNNTSLKKSAVTFGAGYPIRRTNLSIGQINAAFELGKRGTVDNGLIREGFTRFSVGITFNDKWFIKRRYD